VTYLGRRRAVLQQQRNQNGGVSGERVQARVLFGGVKEELARRAVGKTTDMGPEAVACVLKLECDGAAAIRQPLALSSAMGYLVHA
jgi:hypothetical protein